MSDLLKPLNKEQEKAVTHTQGPLMIIAGAGTGKTMVITHRIAYLMEQGLAKPEEILALTFTEKAAAEMEERLDRLLPYGYIDIQISTFHAFCERILREYAIDIGLPRDFKLVSELDAWLLIRKTFDRFNLDYYRPLGSPTRYIKSLLDHFSRAKDEMIEPEDYLRYAQEKEADLDGKTSDEQTTTEVKRLLELSQAYHTYQQILLDNNALDFGDLILYTLRLFKTRPNILNQLRERFRFLLIDEFQDTNLAQYELIKFLSAPKNNLAVVGDDDQSIYKFRGASLSNILQFETDFPQSKRVILTRNYRSVQKILDCAYKFIQANNPNRLEARSEKDGSIKKQLQAHQSQEGIIEHLHFDTIEQEVEGVAKKIIELKETQSDVSWNDFGILLRANGSADPFVEYFEKIGIPYQFMALRGLYQKPLILDMIAFFRFIDEPQESASSYRVLNRVCELSMTDLVQITHEAHRKSQTIYETICSIQTIHTISEQSRKTIESLLHLLSSLQEESRVKTASELFLQVFKEAGFLKRISKQSEQKQHELFRYFQQFYERIRRFEEQNSDKHLHAFFAEFDHERESGEQGSLSPDVEAGPEMVRIMTVHGSKGLEFRFVFIVNLVDRRFPTIERKDPIELPLDLIKEPVPVGDIHLEEERRLFYVAMTRAKEGLFFTSAKNYGGARLKKCSRFLSELGFIQKEKYKNEPTALIQPLIIEGSSEKSFSFILPKYYSFTQLTAFKTCPLQYKFAHLLKIPVFGRSTFSYGKTMHETLQKWFALWIERKNKRQTSLFANTLQKEVESDISFPATLKELLEIYEQTWIDDWYQNAIIKEQYKEEGRVCLKSYVEFLKKHPPKPLALEQGFTLKIGSISIRGRIDRLDEFEDGVEVIDYKTGAPKQEKKISQEEKQQLLLYQIAIQEVFHLKPKKLTFHYLKDHSQISFLGNEQDLEKAKQMIKEQVESMKQGYFGAKPGFHCRSCDFADICEFKE